MEYFAFYAHFPVEQLNAGVRRRSKAVSWMLHLLKSHRKLNNHLTHLHDNRLREHKNHFEITMNLGWICIEHKICVLMKVAETGTQSDFVRRCAAMEVRGQGELKMQPKVKIYCCRIFKFIVLVHCFVRWMIWGRDEWGIEAMVGSRWQGKVTKRSSWIIDNQNQWFSSLLLNKYTESSPENLRTCHL
jgi:hypothetical protein